jgi:hypothetical protein
MIDFSHYFVLVYWHCGACQKETVGDRERSVFHSHTPSTRIPETKNQSRAAVVATVRRRAATVLLIRVTCHNIFDSVELF